MSTSEAPTAFVPLAEVSGPLELRRKSWRKGTHDLVAGDRLVARLDYGRWSGKSRAQAADGEWAIEPTRGRNLRTMKIIDPGSERELASFNQRTWRKRGGKRGGSVELAGASYALTASGKFKLTWRWERDGRELVTFEETSSLGEAKAHVTLTDAGRADPHASLLILLAVHVALTLRIERAVAAAGASYGGGGLLP